MSKQELLNKIINNIDDVSKIGNKFKKNKQIPKIEIDLALSKIRNLYDLLLLFDDANMDSFEQIGKDIDAETISKTKAVDSDEKKKTNIKEKTSENKDKEIDNIETDFDSEKEINENYDNEIIIEEDNFQEEKFGNNKPDNSEIRKENKEKIMADKFESKKFRHDNISKNNNKTDLSSKIQTKSIKDINSVIGMNDKFVFIRELFAGDNQQYRDTIQVLNNFDSYENAYNFLSENFNWNLDDANVSKLLEILKRRYL